MTRAQQTEEAYPDLSVLEKELEKTQRVRNKANLDRDQAKLDRDQAQLDRDQAVTERYQTRRMLEMLRAEHQQELRVRENAANCEQLKSEMERIQQRQRELDMIREIVSKREPGPRSEWLPARGQSHGWRWTKFSGQGDGLTLTARFENT